MFSVAFLSWFPRSIFPLQEVQDCAVAPSLLQGYFAREFVQADPFSATSHSWYLKTLLTNRSVKATGSEMSSLSQLSPKQILFTGLWEPFVWLGIGESLAWDRL